MSPVPLELMRGVLVLLCLFFAHFLGRAIVRARRGERPGAMYSWAVRTLLAGAAIAWRHGLDTTTLLAWAAAGVSLMAGIRLALRPPKPEEDLTRQIFTE